MRPVEIRETTLRLPVYALGEPEPEPPLRPGSAGGPPIYPYPRLETFAETPEVRDIEAVVLENEYLRLTFLPAWNARLYSLYDKLAGQEVLYANPEFKPALVGLRGAWWAAGIEVNFPQSHTVTTVSPVSCLAEVDRSGVARFVAWDLEATSGLAWECATSLAPDSAAIDMLTRLANPTDFPRRFYFWVNAAFPLRPGSRYIFPPSTHRIFCEGGDQPGELGYLDYPIHDGVDVSLFENLRRHSAHFAETPDEGFFGLHHPATDTGVAHVADPSLTCGRKIWSWGHAPDGRLWHDRLTDTGGPYCEVQSGPLRSQLEYRFLAPGQEIQQRDTWLPLRGLGGLNWATESVALAWRTEGAELLVRALARSPLGRCEVRLGDQTRAVVLGPEPVEVGFAADAAEDLTVVDAEGYAQARARLSRPPRREAPALRPRRVTAGQRARWAEWCGRADAPELYRQAAEEDVDAAVALTRFALLADDLEAAERWARRALNLDWHDPEALRVNALTARRAGRTDREQWFLEEMLGHAATRAGGQLGLIDLALRQGRFELAASRCEQLLSEAVDVRVYGRLAHALRRLGDRETIRSLGRSAPVRLEPLLAAERRLADRTAPPLTVTGQLAAAELLHAFGDLPAAEAILSDASGPAPGTPPALLAYALAYVRDEPPPEQAPWPEGWAAGPFAIRILEHAVRLDGEDHRARYHLACALAHAGRWAEAGVHWAVCADGPWGEEAHRNLGLAAWRIDGDRPAAVACYAAAVALDAGPQTILELDRLLAELDRHGERLSRLSAALERFPDEGRLRLALIDALLATDRASAALELLTGFTYHLYEGGSLSQQLWRRAHLAEADRLAGEPAAAAEHVEQAADYPTHLGVGAPGLNRDAELWWRAAGLWRAAGRPDRAITCLERGAADDEGLRRAPAAGRERIPEWGALGLSRGWLRNRVARLACLRALGRPEVDDLLRRTEALVAARDDSPATRELLDRARAGLGPAD